MVNNEVIIIEFLNQFKFAEGAKTLMPKMFKLDSYEECFKYDFKYSENVYCIADVYIKSNKSSEVWNLISANSKPWKTHYRHDHLVYGVCVNPCKAMMSKFDAMTQRQFISSEPIEYKSLNIDPFTFHHAIEDKIMNEEKVKECINHQMIKEFEIEAFSEVQYCEIDGRVEEVGKTFIVQCFNLF